MAHVIQCENGSVHTIFDLKGIKDIVDPAVYDVIETLMIEETNKLKETITYLESEVKSYDTSLYALRGSCRDSIDMLEKLEINIENNKRLNRTILLKLCRNAINSIEDSEGFF